MSQDVKCNLTMNVLKGEKKLFEKKLNNNFLSNIPLRSFVRPFPFH
jgi:hypothetical protein